MEVTELIVSPKHRWTFDLGRCLAIGSLLALAPAGCSRSDYFQRADRDAYSALGQQTRNLPSQVEKTYRVEPDARSRFFDPTNDVDPLLPTPAPDLYCYNLPKLKTEPAPARQLNVDLNDGFSSADSNEGGENAEEISPQNASPNGEQNGSGDRDSNLPPPRTDDVSSGSRPKSASGKGGYSISLASHTEDALVENIRNGDLEAIPIPTVTAIPGGVVRVANHISFTQPMRLQQDASSQDTQSDSNADAPNDNQSDDDQSDGNQSDDNQSDDDADEFSDDALRIVAIPTETWNSIPNRCLVRMLEFGSVQSEYSRTFGRLVTEADFDDSARLTLNNILELTLINSREYQSQKELLYRTSLRLSLERFAYQLKFLRRGNGTDLNYTQNRFGGQTVNTLGIPSGIGLTKSLWTGGELAARLANSVVLTFNGPAGFSSEVGSELLVDLSQPLIQIDERFESLTQTERDVVYAARDYIRFRKQLYRDLTSSYYQLLLTYRSIEINTQDYFSNLRGFNRSQAEYRAGELPRYQVDQFEQNALRSRSNLISACNALESSIDRLKLSIGLPTELPLNISLSELESLTVRDEATVSAELVRRTRRNLENTRSDAESEPIVLVSNASALTQRILDLANARRSIELGGKTDQSETETDSQSNSAEANRADNPEDVVLRKVRETLAELQVTEAELAVESRLRELSEPVGANLLPVQVFFRLLDLIDQNGIALERMLELGSLNSGTEELSDANAETLELLREQRRKRVSLAADLKEAVDDQRFNESIDGLVADARTLLDATTQLRESKRQELVLLGVLPEDRSLDDLLDRVIQFAQDFLGAKSEGLVDLEINVDRAMMTALNQRLDLKNRRGELADAWREIKYAGDDLRSILNVNASQSIRTRSGSNNPVDFTFDDSTTRVGLSFDSPLNRRLERNVFRNSLINYNAALRRVIASEDTIKLAIRQGLRQLQLDQEQYRIAVASSALAFERVVSTRLQLQVGTQNVTARDFLEAQQAYTESLSSLARQHIAYIVDRIDLFVDLEQLQVDPLLQWADLQDESSPFIPQLDFAAGNPFPYGRLPREPWFSDCIRRMENVPAGQARFCRPIDSTDEKEIEIQDIAPSKVQK